jgi:tRNA (guanine-N7-)-methyltransferase
MRTRQHVNPLGPSFEVFRGEHPRLEEGRPVEVEIGCADAQFLFERAAADPARTYLGFEVRNVQVDQVNRRAALEGLPVQGIFANANLHLDKVVPENRVDRVYVNFPDPWFKMRQRKRRMVDDTLVRAIHTVCRPGAEVFFQSDVWSLALDALAVFEMREELFENRAGAWTFWKQGNPYGVRSWREQNAELEGLKVWRLMYLARAAQG